MTAVPLQMQRPAHYPMDEAGTWPQSDRICVTESPVCYLRVHPLQQTPLGPRPSFAPGRPGQASGWVAARSSTVAEANAQSRETPGAPEP